MTRATFTVTRARALSVSIALAASTALQLQMGLLSVIIFLGALVLSLVERAHQLDLLEKNAFVSEKGFLRLDNSVLSSYAATLYNPPASINSSAHLFFSTFFTFSANSSFQNGALSFIMTPFSNLTAIFPDLSSSPPSLHRHVVNSSFAFILNVNISESAPDNGLILGISATNAYPQFLSADIFVSKSWILLNESHVEFSVSVIYDATRNHSLSLHIAPNNDTLKRNPVVPLTTTFTNSGTLTLPNVSDFSNILSNSTYVGFVATGGVFDVSQWNVTIHDSSSQLLTGTANHSTSLHSSILSAYCLWLALGLAAAMNMLSR